MSLFQLSCVQVERVLLKQFHLSKGHVTGTLCLTDRHLFFIEPTGAQETWVRNGSRATPTSRQHMNVVVFIDDVLVVHTQVV